MGPAGDDFDEVAIGAIVDLQPEAAGAGSAIVL